MYQIWYIHNKILHRTLTLNILSLENYLQLYVQLNTIKYTIFIRYIPQLYYSYILFNV